MTETRRKIAVGMSGGVDSTVAALLLRDKGFEVLGMTLRLRDESTRRVGLADAERAAVMAHQLGIPHEVVDARAAFEERIVKPFADEYACGRTPSPCVRCNPLIKFGLLLEEAQQRGCDAVATGHYVQAEIAEGTWHLRRGVDPRKDQSYFLHRLIQNQLSCAVFPLGGLHKDEVRRYAVGKGLESVPSGESQDLCFVESGHYAAFVERVHPEIAGPGHIVDESGRVLGAHPGFYHYTVGQRKGLGLAAEEPYYVKKVRPETNEVVVGFHRDVEAAVCRLIETSWIRGAPETGRFQVQIRYRHRPVWAHVEADADGRTLVEFEEPQFAIAPGQAGVVYDGDEVLGGGWIAS
ncbi:MAG: tRNA 2-thiouridine(34) synthase MnmA [Kiritimatiellae bacterium]|nr:tRNA 2-thiouridine(34) synthase MnmA [Kiritimatiellia bacterium]